MFKEDSAEMKLCYGMLLQSVASTLGWSGFYSSAHSDLQRGNLKYISLSLLRYVLCVCMFHSIMKQIMLTLKMF